MKREVMLRYINKKKLYYFRCVFGHHYANLTSRQSCRSTILLSRYVIVADNSLLIFFWLWESYRFRLGKTLGLKMKR